MSLDCGIWFREKVLKLKSGQLECCSGFQVVSFEVFQLQMESPEALIIPVNLQGPNYSVWSRMMKIALVEKGLWRHCSSDDVALNVEGEASSELAHGEAWKREDLLVLFTIELNMAQSILEAHAYCESAKELWSTLKLIYGNGVICTKSLSSRRLSTSYPKKKMSSLLI